jgi:hypothetical protein
MPGPKRKTLQAGGWRARASAFDTTAGRHDPLRGVVVVAAAVTINAFIVRVPFG